MTDPPICSGRNVLAHFRGAVRLAFAYADARIRLIALPSLLGKPAIRQRNNKAKRIGTAVPSPMAADSFLTPTVLDFP